MRPIDEGEGRTFEVNGRYIFRFARDERGAEKLRRELCLLSAVGSELPIAVPVPEFVGEPGPRYPFPYVGYAKIDGRSGEDARPERDQWPAVARQLGEFLSALHNAPIATGTACGLPVERMEEPASLLRGTTRYRDLLRSGLPDVLDARMAALLAGDVPVPPASRAAEFVCHADVKGEHLLLDKGAQRVVGVIDWTDCCLTDRLLDFTGLMIWLGEAFLQEVLGHYSVPTDEHFIERVCFYARCFALGNLGRRLTGRDDAPLELLKTQARWAFR